VSKQLNSTQLIKDNCSPEAGLKIKNKIDKHTTQSTKGYK